jgi:chemotaxis protein MotB
MKNSNDKREILIEGHTDNAPVSGEIEDKYKNNWGLSSFRASEVVTYLINDLGVPKNRLRAIGYADQWPAEVSWSQVRSGSVNAALIDSLNKSDIQKQKNRRIKIIFATR